MRSNWAHLCVSESKSLSMLGRDAHEINNLVCKFSAFLLNREYRLIFGHDWREDGVMRAVAVLAEKSTEEFRHLDKDDFPRMLNLIPKPLAELQDSGIRAAEESGGVLEVFSLVELGTTFTSRRAPKWLKTLTADRVFRTMDHSAISEDPVYQNWMLRYAMTRIGSDGICVCLGGKSSGYTGMYAGVAEEAYFAMSEGLPLYLVGGFGGATAAIAACFSAKPSSLYIDVDQDEPLKPNQDVLPSDAAWNFAAAKNFPLEGLDEWFKTKGMRELGRANGLNASENEKLFRTTDLEKVLHLVDRGLRRLRQRRR